MTNDISLKKIDESIDYFIRKKNQNFNLESLNNYIISKFNNSIVSSEEIIYLENILMKLMQSGFGNMAKSYCYYLVTVFNCEFSSNFYSSLTSDLLGDILNFKNFELNLAAFKNFINLNEKDITDNYAAIEQILKMPKFDLNIIINSFFYSNILTFLIDIFPSLSFDEFRSHKEFLKKLYMELAKLLFDKKLLDGTFLNVLKILNKMVERFSCLKNLATIEKLINSIIISICEFLIMNIDEVLDMIMSFDLKLIEEVLVFPINIYKIYIFYRDANNPEKKYLQSFQKYINFVFDNIRCIYDPDIFTYVNKTITEFIILEGNSSPLNYSTEIIELVSKFFELSDHFEKNSWFELNMKLLSKLAHFIDYEDSTDLITYLISDCKYISNYSDRIFTLFNLFLRLIIMNIEYSKYFDKESLILCLFKQDWFVFLINKDDFDEKDSRFRHDLFICMIEALFYAKIYILKNGFIKKYINIIKICLDLIDVCFKIIEWSDEGEAYKMYFLVLEETCLFFDDTFFCFLYGQEKEFIQMKLRLEQVLIELSKRFNNKVWQHLSFSNENSKYRSLVLLSQFLNIENIEAIKIILEVIFSRMYDIPYDKKNEKNIEQILKSCIFLGVRVNISTRERIIHNLADFVDRVKNKIDSDPIITSNIGSFGENILNYLLKHKDDPQIILDNKTVDKINNEFYLIIPKDLDLTFNIIKSLNMNYNNLFLINLTENSYTTLDNYNEENTSMYLDYFKKMHYRPMIEFNNENCNMIIDNLFQFKSSDWRLITGIGDPIHIYYMYNLDIEKREIDLLIKVFNSTSCVLNNVSFSVNISKNLSGNDNNGNALNNFSKGVNSQYGAQNPSNKDFNFNIDLVSPYSTHEFHIKLNILKFEKNNINIESAFDMNPEINPCFNLSADIFHIPLTDFFIPDNFSNHESKKFDIIYSTLEFAFTTKCYANLTPEDMIKFLSDRFTLVEYKSKFNSNDRAKSQMDILKEAYFKDFYESLCSDNNQNNNFNNIEDNQRYNFKIKLSSYSVFNFWIYIVIIGDYNFSNNKSILNIEIRSNDIDSLNIINREKIVFLNELFNKQIKFY